MTFVSLLRALLVVPITINVDARVSFLPIRRRCSSVSHTLSLDTSTFNRGTIGLRVRGGHAEYYAKSESSQGGAWDEEIRRTREYYGTPRSSSARPGEVLITGKTTVSESEENDDEGAGITTTTEDEQVFGNAQTASYGAKESDLEELNTESIEELDESDTDTNPTDENPDVVDSDQAGNIEESEAISDQSLSEPAIDTSNQVVYGTSEVPEVEDEEVDVQESAGAIKDKNIESPENDEQEQVQDDEVNTDTFELPEVEDEEVDVQESADTIKDENIVSPESDEEKHVQDHQVDTGAFSEAEDEEVAVQESADAIKDDNTVPPENDEEEQVQDDQINTDEKDVDGEGETPESSSESAHEMKDPESDENETAEEAKADGSERTTMRQSAQDIMKDLIADDEEEEDDQSSLNNKESTILDEYTDGAIPGQEITSISNPGLDSEGVEVQRWQKAPTAAASNKLVEEGLRRLRRNDGDDPSVPYVKTRAMKRVLIDDLGYDPSEVNAMRPDVAVVIIGESLARPDLESLPSRFYNDVEAAVVILDEVEEDRSLNGRIVSLVQRLRKEVSSLFADRDSKSKMLMLASLGVALPLLASLTNHDNIKSWDKAVPAPDIQSSLEVTSDINTDLSEDIEDDLDDSDGKSSAPGLQPDDLDKTWLDKLISVVSKPFGA